MAERVVNLDNIPRPAITLEIAGRQFRIRRVVTGVRQLWAAFVKETAGYLERVDEYDKAVKALQADSGASSLEEIRRRTEEISRRVDEFAQGKLDRLLGMIELLLIKNGYEFERQWWIEEAEEEDYRDFILAAITKDSEGAKKNGDAEEKSTGPA